MRHGLPTAQLPVENLDFVLDSRSKPIFENLKWLTSHEAVTYLRLPSNGALRNLVYRRKIPFVKLGRSLRFDREALDRFLNSSSSKRRNR